MIAAMNKKLLLVAVIAAVGLIAILGFYPENEASASPLDEFAQCLASNGAVMYGNYNCPHCQNEKKAFGDSFKYISYVECTADSKECVSKGINSVPTWIFSGGRKLVGEQGLEKLSMESGCVLPEAGL